MSRDRKGGPRDDRRYDERKRGPDREESRHRREHGSPGQGRNQRSENGSDKRNSQSHFPNRNERGITTFNGAPFSEGDLMADIPKKKFTGRCRLFVGNLPNEVSEDELKKLFSPHGDISECYLSGKGFAFLRLDTRANAESAKEAIDGKNLHGRPIRVRFAVHGAALRIKELSSTVSNEMLYHAFARFGDVERAIHIVDEKGRPTGEGIVEFERKGPCQEALQSIREKVFILTANSKPISAEVLEQKDEDDGLAERMIPRTPQLNKERELGPRFPGPNSFEYIYGMKWKDLYEMEKQRRAQFEKELVESRRRLEADMEVAYQDYQAQMLREDLQRRQQELERLEALRRERTRPPGVGPGSANPPPNSSNGNSHGGPSHPPPHGGPGSGVPMMGPGPGPDFRKESEKLYGGPPGPVPPGGPNSNFPPPHFGRVPPMGGHFPGGPPMNMNFNGPPPNHHDRGERPNQTNMLEGVQRLLQIFKNEPAGSSSPRGPPPMFGYGGPDFPPEKRSRR
ncbi:unnamed protein product [Auanema sp. JU1783]|nr:unnamed protein product [Auanema sp. JU1783]